MRRDDRDDPFDEFFEEIERMMNQMMGGTGEFRIEHSTGSRDAGASAGTDVHFDVHETDDRIRVVADVPGVEKTDINLTCDGRHLAIRAESGDRSYDERITLPAPVDEHSAEASYNNGILEVGFDRAEDTTSIDL